MSAMVAWGEFDGFDWNAYAGAERFPDGSPPRIGFLEVDRVLVTAVHDAAGLVVFLDEDGDECLTIPDDPHEARAVAEVLPEHTSRETLLALGFMPAGGEVES